MLQKAPAVATAGSSDEGWGSPKTTKSGWGSPVTNPTPFQSPAAGNKWSSQDGTKPDAGHSNARPQERGDWGAQNAGGRPAPKAARFNLYQKQGGTEYGQAAPRTQEREAGELMDMVWTCPLISRANIKAEAEIIFAYCR